MPRPPRSTLLPYTTLFRSLRAELRRRGAFADDGPRLDDLCDLVALDRKSTRLNSSHVKISYAVFCLKKKRVVHATQGECAHGIWPQPATRPESCIALGKAV